MRGTVQQNLITRGAINGTFPAAVTALLLLILGAMGLAGSPRAHADPAALSQTRLTVDDTGTDSTTGYVSGSVRSSSGDPVSGLYISVYLNDSLACNAVTDGSGRFSCSFARPAPGNYSVSAVWAGDSENGAARGTSSLTVSAVNRGTSLSLSLDPVQATTGDAVTVAGLLNSDSGPISGAVINLSTSYGDIQAKTATSADGTFTARVTFPDSDTTPSSFTVTASFGGDSVFKPSTNTASGSLASRPTAAPLDTAAPTATAPALPASNNGTPSPSAAGAMTPANTSGSSSPLAAVEIIFFLVALVGAGALLVVGLISHQTTKLARGERRGFGTDFGQHA